MIDLETIFNKIKTNEILIKLINKNIWYDVNKAGLKGAQGASARKI